MPGCLLYLLYCRGGLNKVLASLTLQFLRDRPERDKCILISFLVDNVETSSVIVTDEHSGYWTLPTHGFEHKSCNHTQKQYVIGSAHTNTIEGFWRLFKRGIYGIYHNVSNKHLDRYCTEFSYPYNSRKVTDNDRFHATLTNGGKRLRYQDLIAKAQT